MLQNERQAYAASVAKEYDRIIGYVEGLSKSYESRLGKYAKRISGKVSQVIGNDAMLYPEGSDEPVLVEGIGPEVIDGSFWRGPVFSTGTFEYVTVLGAPKKVLRYSTKPPAQVSEPRKDWSYVQSELMRLRGERNAKLAGE